eukprot:6684467-Alexandrium_andersonii.AAC.1
MSASLVGSEMCIRDSNRGAPGSRMAPNSGQTASGARAPHTRSRPTHEGAVSYTHLTLPTICSV